MAKAKFERTKPHCKREKEVLQFLPLTLSMRQRRDITHTLTARDMLTMLRT